MIFNSKNQQEKTLKFIPLKDFGTLKSSLEMCFILPTLLLKISFAIIFRNDHWLQPLKYNTKNRFQLLKFMMMAGNSSDCVI